MKNFKLINNVVGWSVFLISFIIYLFTLEPTVSFWDCGEFIASSYKMQVGHPPGAPFFQIVQKVFSLLAASPDRVAYFMNAFSGLASALTVMFLYWTIVHLAEKLSSQSDLTKQHVLNMAAGAIGAMSFAFTDSFWFSAVEAEAYAFSSLFTAVVFWAILKWEKEADKAFANRWIILIAYLIGLSIGVHLLNLLAIPAIALIWYFKKYKASAKGIIISIAISFFIILFIMYGMVQGTPNVAQWFEVLFVNSFKLPYNTGLLFFIALLMGLLAFLVYYSHKKKKMLLNIVAISAFMIYLGFSSYAVVMIRSNANPPMDENNPENAYMLMKYLNRSQYGSTPIVSGYYYSAPAVDMTKGKPVYYPKDGKYIKIEGQPKYKFDERFKTIFPRMHSGQGNHVRGYESWGKVEGRQITVRGQKETIPTFAENLRFFFSYQLNHMYIRYFMWNFSGRQNDIQGHGDVLNGNWLTGIGFIDKMRLGYEGDQPDSLSNPKTNNKYYMLPFLLGLLGAFFHYKNKQKDFWVVALLFAMTGIAIVVYLNQTPQQPRERDYAYAGSFYAYAIWIGMGVLGLASFLKKFLKNNGAIVAMVLCTGVPVLLLAENYDDHDRSNRYMARDIGKNYLNSCDEHAILFTYGDNDTFPLWYAQDVESVRPDVRICNVTLLNSQWYIDQMRNKTYESDPLPIEMPYEKYEANTRNTLFVREDIKRPVELSSLMKLMLSDNKKAKVRTQGGTFYNYLPTRKIKITVDKEQVLATGTVLPERADEIVDSIVFNVQGNYITKSDLAVLDILANNDWKRPVYFDLSVLLTTNLNLNGYLQHEGFAYRLLPIKSEDQYISNSAKLHDRLMTKYVWGNIYDPNIFIGENTRRTTEVVRIKDNFFTLADLLYEENKNEEATAVLNKLYDVMPLGRFYTNYNDVKIAGLYYAFGEDEKALTVLKQTAKECKEKAEFYLNMEANYRSAYQRDTNREIAILQEIAMIAESNNHKDFSKTIKETLETLNVLRRRS